MANEGTFQSWCRHDFATMSLQRPDPAYRASQPTRLTQSVPVTRGQGSAAPRVHPGPAPAARVVTDNIAHWTAPPSVAARGSQQGKFSALSRSDPWTPHSANEAGARRAVYDPVAHKTTIFTFDGKDGVSRTEGKGDALLKVEQQRVLNDSAGAKWNGRRKGVVEFKDRTHNFAVNKSESYLNGMRDDPKSYARVTGEMTNWFDRGFQARVKLPFYDKTPRELGK